MVTIRRMDWHKRILLGILVLGYLIGSFPEQMNTTKRVFADPGRDVAITNIVPAKTVREGGKTLNVNVTVANEGDVQESFDVELLRIGTARDLTILGSVETGFNNSKPGPSIEVNFGDTIVIDRYEENGTGWKGFFVDYNHNNQTDPGNQTYPGDPGGAYEGRTFIFVANTAGEFMYYWPMENGTRYRDVNGTFVVRDTRSEAEIGTLSVVSLAPGESRSMIYSWDTHNVPVGFYKVKAVTDAVPSETDTDDNSATTSLIARTIAGDVDAWITGSRYMAVDIRDVVVLTSCYGTNKTHPWFKPNADLDDDGKVSILDIVSVCGRYGNSYPPNHWG